MVLSSKKNYYLDVSYDCSSLVLRDAILTTYFLINLISHQLFLTMSLIYTLYLNQIFHMTNFVSISSSYLMTIYFSWCNLSWECTYLFSLLLWDVSYSSKAPIPISNPLDVYTEHCLLHLNFPASNYAINQTIPSCIYVNFKVPSHIYISISIDL